VIESRDAIFYENNFTTIPKSTNLNVVVPIVREDNKRNANEEPPELRRSKRARKRKTFGLDFIMHLVEGTRYSHINQTAITQSIEFDPLTYEEAIKSSDFAFWKEVIDEEMSSIMNNKTWKLIDLPLGSRPIGCKWIFKKKMKVDGNLDKFKTRLVAKGFTQNEGLDYFDIYALVARTATIRTLIALASIYKFEIHQMNVKIAF